MQRATPKTANRAAVLLVCAALSGCGLKGNLYLPPEPLEPESSVAGEANAEAAVPTPAPSGELDTVPPEQPEPSDAIEGTDDFDDRPREDRLP